MSELTEEAALPRIVIVSDSLGMPRPHESADTHSELADTYPHMLEQRFRSRFEVDNLFSIQLDTEELLRRSLHRTIAFRRPRVIIVHLGINDCAPRLFRKNSRSLLLVPWFRRATRDIGMRVLSRYRRYVTRVRPIRYVSAGDFESNLRRAIDEFRLYAPEALVLGVSITPPAGWLAARSYHYAEEVDRYNQVLERVFGDGFVDTRGLLDEAHMYISDGYHLTKAAHAALAEKLRERIDRFDRERSA